MTPASKKPLKIAQVAPLWTAVPPRGYGGAELMVHWLTEDLVRCGHDVTLFASADSRTAARLRPTVERNLIDAMAAGEADDYTPYALAAMVTALRESRQFDVMHVHLGAPFLPLGALAQCPVVHTVHAGLVHTDELRILDANPDAMVAAISGSQVALVPAERRRRIPVIHHGCEFREQDFCGARGTHVLFLGRMGPHKNPVDAIRLASALGLPIVLAGRPQDRGEQRFFETEVQPLLDAPGVCYVGEIDQAAKLELLRTAAALAFPIRWDEHFGLVMIEAMACGTPVLAYARGSVPEVIDGGVTGFHAPGFDELAELAPRALALDRRAVFEHARSRFDVRVMTDAYVRLYESVRGERRP